MATMVAATSFSGIDELRLQCLKLFLTNRTKFVRVVNSLKAGKTLKNKSISLIDLCHQFYFGGKKSAKIVTILAQPSKLQA